MSQSDNPIKKPAPVLPFEIYRDPTRKLLIEGVEYVLIDPGKEGRPATGYERMLYTAYVDALERLEEAERQLEYMRRLRE